LVPGTQAATRLDRSRAFSAGENDVRCRLRNRFSFSRGFEKRCPVSASPAGEPSADHLALARRRLPHVELIELDIVEPQRHYELKSELVPPVPVNRLFEKILDGERLLIERGVSLGVGGSLMVVARREPVRPQRR
jgi:hypothetical protein